MTKENDEVEIEVTEISLSEREIDEWIEKLEELKEMREPITLELDDESDLEINFLEDEMEEE